MKVGGHVEVHSLAASSNALRGASDEPLGSVSDLPQSETGMF